MNLTETGIISLPGFADPVSCWTHLLGAVVALFTGIFWVIRFRGQRSYRTALIVFVAGTVLMFSMSGVYHLLSEGTARAVLRRLDHAAIWLMIAGSFTAIHTFHFRRWARWGVLAFVWTVAINGIVFKTVYFDDFPNWLGMTLYLGFGWVGLLSAFLLIRSIGVRGTRLMVAGGLAYSIGAAIEAAQLPALIPGVVGAHELFHLGVLIGAACHWRFVWNASRILPLEATETLTKALSGPFRPQPSVG